LKIELEKLIFRKKYSNLREMKRGSWESNCGSMYELDRPHGNVTRVPYKIWAENLFGNQKRRRERGLWKEI
jgi:hypothetical protein